MKNKIQYIARTHTTKDEAVHNKATSNSIHSVFMADLTFDEIVDAQDTGLTIGRIGDKTSYLMIDIDNSTVNISQIREIYKDNKDIKVTYSASMNPLKYHIFVNLHREISYQEYRTEVTNKFNEIHDKVRSELGRCNFMELDTCADTFYQCYFGVPQSSSFDYILDNSTQLYCWTRKGNEPRILITEKTIVNHMTMNSAEYCKKNGLLTIKESKRFDIVLPSMTKGRMKPIAEGYRYNWCKMIGAKILMRTLYLNHEFNEGWTKFDFLNTFEYAVRCNIVKSNEFCNSADYKGLVNFFDLYWVTLKGKSFDEQCNELEPYFNCSKRQYKSRFYNETIMNQMITEHYFDDKTILFTDRDELTALCKEMMIDYYKFIKYAKEKGFDVEYECVTERSRKSKYDCTGMNKEQFNEYCKENNINKVTKARLKKKYNIE